VTTHSVALTGLQPGTTYHYKVRSQATDEDPVVGADAVFTTAASATCPCSLWPDSTTPAGAVAPSGAPIEVGVRFQADAAGYVTGLRFYKDAVNAGTHTG